MTKQSSDGLTVLPPWVLFVAAACWAAVPAAAQQSFRVVRAENFRAEPAPDGALLATVVEGTVLRGGATRGQWLEVTLEGWIWAPSVGPSDRAGYDVTVSRSPGENLRAGPNRDVLARLRTGTLLNAIARENGWVHVRRTAWMWRQSVEPLPHAAPPAAGPAAGGAAAPAEPRPGPAAAPGLDRVRTNATVSVLQRPEGDTVGTLVSDMPARVLARSGEWVRLGLEVWVRDTDVRPAADGVLVGVTGAEVRTRPDDFEGRLLQWSLQYISIQQSDELRREMDPGTPFMLARGPLPEAGFVYVMLTAAQRRQIADLPPLTELTVIGRVRVARSRYVGNPVLELVDLALPGDGED